MKALTLWPEWAWAIRRLGKDVENRSWAPPGYLVGRRLAIHAGAFVGGRKGSVAEEEGVDALVYMADRAGWTLRVEDGAISAAKGQRSVKERIAVRAIVATVRLDGWTSESESPWAVPGQVHWLLSAVEPVAALPRMNGRQGLWDVPRDAARPCARIAGEP